jgi:hypothetical protein
MAGRSGDAGGEGDGAWGDAAADGAVPDVGWARTSGEPRDFLGNEMLIWLWYVADQQEGLVTVRDPDDANREAELAIAFDKTLEMECAWGVTGKQTLREHAGGVAPVRMPEAAEALSLGKWPRKTGLILADNSTGEEAGQVWSLTLQADRWMVTAAALPSPAEEIDNPREEREFRLGRVTRLDRLLLAVYQQFLDMRTGAEWPEVREHITRWVRDHRARRVKGLARPATAEAKPAPLRVGA